MKGSKGRKCNGRERVMRRRSGRWERGEMESLTQRRKFQASMRHWGRRPSKVSHPVIRAADVGAGTAASDGCDGQCGGGVR